MKVEADLWHAVKRQELILHYQPIIDLKDGCVAGVEALVRWQHPRHGLMPPHDFIPLAEETGIILPLDLWVLETACRQAGAWRRQAGTRSQLVMNVNLSATHFQQANAVAQIAAVLEATGMEPAGLELEITESAVISDAESSIATLRALRDLGVRLAIDDFGTGYSSLSYLHRFAVDSLKIDQSFISALGDGGGSGTIVRAIAGLAHDLGMAVTAEGIETAEQLEQVQTAGCDFGQGFHFFMPMPGETLSPLLRRDRG